MKIITIKCSKDIYDEIKKCGYFPTTELIQPEDEVEFVSVNKHPINKCKYCYTREKSAFNQCTKCGGWAGGATYDYEKYGTHKATPYALSDDIEIRKEPISYEEYYYYFVREGYKMYDLSEKLYNWIKENFKGNFIMNRLYEKDNDAK